MRKTIAVAGVVSAALGTACTVAVADDAEGLKRDLARCAAIENTVERGACFDALADEADVARPASSTTRVGRWNSREDVSPIDDTKSVYLSLYADSEVQIGRYDRVTPILWLRCFENTTSLFIGYDHFLGSDDTAVTYRIDDQDARTETWDISTSHYSVGLWRGGRSIPLIRRLLDAEQFVVRLVPYSESAVTVTFTVGGLRDAIGPLAEACHWSPQSPGASSSNGGSGGVSERRGVRLASSSSAAARAQFQTATALLAQGRYAEAETALQRFVGEYPTDPLVVEAHYWLGETYYVRGRYDDAAITFAQAYQRYPNSDKAPGSLLKLAMALAAQGKAEDACLTFSQLEAEFPDAPAAVRIRGSEESSRLNC